jgi:two pore calcium channel protein 1/two pore calcium channel protein 3
MFIAASWNQLIFELTYDTDDMVSAMVFIGSFEFVSLFLLSLIGGLVWEVFSIVSLSMKEEEDEVLL